MEIVVTMASLPGVTWTWAVNYPFLTRLVYVVRADGVEMFPVRSPIWKVFASKNLSEATIVGAY